MSSNIFKRLTFLATAAFMAAIGVLCLGIGYYWFNFIVPSIQAGEKVRAEMVMAQLTEKLEPALEKSDQAALKDLMARLLLMKDPSIGKNLILGIRVETLDGILLTQYSKEPVEISGPFALTAPLYSSTTHEVLGEVSFQYNPYFNQLLVEDARTKLFWFLALMAGVIFLLQRVLFHLLRPLSELSRALGNINFSQPAPLPEIKGLIVSEVNEVVQSMKELLGRLEKSRESEAKARNEMERAQAVSHTGSWVWNIKTNGLTWSDEIYRIAGFQPGEIEPNYKTFLDLIHPDDRSLVEESVAKAVGGQQEYDIVHRLVRRDGTIRFIREKSLVTFNKDSEAIGMIGTAQDVTEQKLAEDLSLRFGRIMDEAFNEIYIMDAITLKFTKVNQSVCQNIGYTAEEMAAMTPHDIAPELSKEQMNALFQSMRDGTESMRVVQTVHRRKDGTDYPVEVRLQLSKHETPPQFVAIVQDITEQKQAEDLALRFGRIMEESFNEIFIFDENSLRFKQVNQGARENLGYTMEELSQITPVDIKPEYNLEQFEGLLQILRDGTKELLVFETIHQRKDGSTYPVEIRLQLSKLETPPQFVAIVQDITERKKAEQAMQQAMQTLEARVQERTADLEKITRENELILNSAGEGICGIDNKGIIKFANPAAHNILGYAGKDCSGKPHHDTCHHKRSDGSPYPHHECPIEKSLQDGKSYKANDEVFWRKDGTAVPVEYVSNPIHEDGKVVGAVVTFKDITERKRAEEELKTSEERFRSYFELPLVGIAITSPEKGWLEVNDRLCDFLGYSREELKTMTWMELTYPDDLEAVVTKFNEVFEGKSDGYSMEKRFVHKSGEVIHAEISSRCVRKPNGEIDYFIALIQDIGDRKKAEQEMILAKEEAEQANNAKSEFLSQMSHELRTPLNAILGFSQVMESDPEEPLTEFQQQSVSEILKGGSHLLALINEILDLSRIESGHLTLSLENVNLDILTEELVTLCDPMAKKVKVELLNYVPLHEELYVFADRVRLKQVLLNLISNAIKYNKSGGAVKIDATANKQGGICISVTDTGMGIPEDKLGDLFQPFNRLGSERTEIEGTGVGLTITKRLAEHMHGTIDVESQAGQGSTFSVTFPIGKKEEESLGVPKIDVSREINLSPSRDQWVVLYVEDNPANLNLVRHIFRRRSDVVLLTAPAAKLGIELAEVHRPDLILLDINLPGMDGLTAFKYLNNMEETRNTPVIAVSANAMPRDIKKALEAGFSDYLTKPLDVAEFNRVIEEHLKVGLRQK